jgi:hypothetical protein
MTDTTTTTNPELPATRFPTFTVTGSSCTGTDAQATGRGPAEPASRSTSELPALLSPHTPALEGCAGGSSDVARVADLSRQVAEVRAAHEQDVATIGQALLREAADRGWCEDYDRMVETLNHDLQVPLETRVRTYEVTFDLRVTIQVEASTEDRARERAADLAGRIEDEVRGLNDVAGCVPDHPGDFDIAAY